MTYAAIALGILIAAAAAFLFSSASDGVLERLKTDIDRKFAGLLLPPVLFSLDINSMVRSC